MLEAAVAEAVWTAMLEEETTSACGLGARDTLRTEAGFALYGHDIDLSTNPFEARLGWVVNSSKPAFVGRDALMQLKAAGPSRKLVVLRVAPGCVPRPGFAILDGGQHIVSVTSGTVSPT